MSRYGECACCGAVGPLSGRGLVRHCQRRYQAADLLDEWPTERELVEEDVRMVLATGVPYRVVAARCGVSERRVLRILARDRLAVVGGTGPAPGVVRGPVRAAQEAAA